MVDPNDPTPAYGGGIDLRGGTMLVIRSTLHSNRAHAGSAIYCEDATLNTVNTTFADNVGTPLMELGALHLVGCDTVIDSTTFSGNQPFAIGGFHGGDPGSLTLRNTYIDDYCNFAYINFCPTSEGGNMEGHGTCCLTAPGDAQWATNQVGPLGDHGGHTWTMLPLPLTSLLDNPWADANCRPEDQRLVTRPQSGLPGAPIACDTGAVELRQEDLVMIFADGFESGNTSAWSTTAP